MRSPFGIRKIISGGQTGADRAALDVAGALGIAHGGSVPKGRQAEDGPVPDRYDMTELADGEYGARTEANVVDADATLIVSIGPLTGGSALTRRLADRHHKPVLHIELSACSAPGAVDRVRAWLMDRRPAVLNVAGPRESTEPGAYAAVRSLLWEVLEDVD